MEDKIKPSEITRDELNDIASFTYYVGLHYAMVKELKQTTDMEKCQSRNTFYCLLWRYNGKS
jgi:hypothetical protein